MKLKIGQLELLEFKDLPVSRTTAWRLMNAKKLGFYRIGRRVYFSPEHIAELLRNCEVSPELEQKNQKN